MKRFLMIGFCLAILSSVTPVAMGHQVVDETTITQGDQLLVQHFAPTSIAIKAQHVDELEVMITAEVPVVEFNNHAPKTAYAELATVITPGYTPDRHCNSPPFRRCRG